MLSATGNSPEILLWRHSTPLTRTQFLCEATAIAQQLPPGQFLLNLCEQREAFMLAFAAAVIARRTLLMPSARGEHALAELTAGYPDNLRVTDEDIQRWRVTDLNGHAADPAPAEDAQVMIGFTSGSTGRSQSHPKRWRTLANGARLNALAIRDALGLPDRAPVCIVGTVPPHHMYGIEFTVLLPLFANMSVHAGRPLFPADVAGVLAQAPQPRVLVSTPLHLRALADSGVAFPAPDLIVSATAPLDPALARRVEERLRAPLLEVFGSTETGAFATRSAGRNPEWRLYDGVDFTPGPESTRIDAGWFEQAQQLQDLFEMRGARGFVLLGRNSDLVEVAGKRASLADITRRLCAVPGVEDAVAFQPESGDSGVANRIAALVVSRTLSAPEIARHVAGGLDAALVPRPLLVVERIPRDQVGKVSRARLLQLARGAAVD